MFRPFALGSAALLGLLIPSASQAQVVVSVPLPIVYRHYHDYRVQYRVSIWESRTFCDYGEARRFERLKLLDGFDTQVVRIGPDWQVRYRVAAWQTYATVLSHREAHDLEAYLESRGYVARVLH